ncbi:EamA family transporter [Thermanaerosceptrum fracticalcis]|uniref:EamA family transporter n=1 Tax=Thermanaerosceptrum fracticalcis TaxID=1712410 RepID=A0A7G6E660_THEFR|nr:DMT family transporter [Thermanaerosceptrum fracticalcis]QNB47564.1 EamA family transporter [Thermanaerosceptrum fracticalcis]
MTKLAPWQADLLLLGVAATWGATFITVKNALGGISPFVFITIRFTLAFLFLLLIYRPEKELLKRRNLRAGVIIGLFLFGGYAFQTVGLQYTSAANAGFITGLSVVLVPLLSIFISKKYPNLYVLGGALAASLGLGLMTLDEHLSFHPGDLLILLCAVSFALHIITIGIFAPHQDTTILTVTQIGFVALLSLILTFFLPQETWQITWRKDLWIALGLTAIPATSLAILIQNRVQQYTSPARTAIIFATEPVFGAFFAWYFGGEILTGQAVWGAALVLTGMLLAELKE